MPTPRLFGAIALVATFFSAGAPVAAAQEAAQEAAVTIIHVNDLDRIEAVDGVGGLAKLAAVVAAERAKGGTVLVTHGGDAISPSLPSAFDQGAHMIDLLNRIGLNAFVLGNHEFDFGPDVAAARIAEAAFPVLATNVRWPDGPPPGLVDRLTIEVDGFAIGLFGLTTATTNVKSSPAPAVVEDPLAVAAETAAALRADGADLVVALAHTNRAEDAALVDQGAVDVILSGDDHDLRAVQGRGPLLIESGSQAGHIAVVTLRLRRIETRGRRRVAWRPDVRFVDSAAIAPDPAMAAAVQGYLDRLADDLDIPIGVTETPLDSRRGGVRRGEAAIGNLIADAMRAAVGADVALTNGGGIRAHRAYAAGTTLTRRDILSELPFGDRTVLLEIDGATLRAALEHGFAQADRPAGRFPQVSGLSVVFDPAAPPGRRIATLAVGDAPVEDGRFYRLATNAFLARGGDGYAAFADPPRIIDEDAGGLIVAQVIAAIEAAGRIAPRVEGRIRTR